MTTAALVDRLLDVIERDIAPLTQQAVTHGNKLFGAAILRKSDLSVVIAETNNEIENPLWHGEMHAIKRFFELPEDQRPDVKDCIFLATHEPCSLCLSGITWSGFDNFYYLFSYQDTRDSFAIPHDIAILKAVYAVPEPETGTVSPDRPLYNRANHYWTSHSIAQRWWDGSTTSARSMANCRRSIRRTRVPAAFRWPDHSGLRGQLRHELAARRIGKGCGERQQAQRQRKHHGQTDLGHLVQSGYRQNWHCSLASWYRRLLNAVPMRHSDSVQNSPLCMTAM